MQKLDRDDFMIQMRKLDHNDVMSLHSGQLPGCSQCQKVQSSTVWADVV